MKQTTLISRRQLLWNAGALGAAAGTSTLLAGCPPDASPLPDLDTEIFNFALNLEYLEAEYYLRAFGDTLDEEDIGEDAAAVTGGAEVDFMTELLREHFLEIAADERAHVRYLRSKLGANAVARPAIDFEAGFAGLAGAAGLPEGFDPFGNEEDFILGAFLFEDVGVSAYKGASPLIVARELLQDAAGILAAEAYHAGLLRKIATDAGLQAEAQLISDARDSVDGGTELDEGIGTQAAPNIVPADERGITFSRGVSQVLRVVYLTADRGITSGGFFPEGMNGPLVFRTT